MSDFAGVDPATLQKWLLEAQTALHKLSSGGQPQMVSYGMGDGQRSVTFTKTNIGQLRAHIGSLLAALTPGKRSRPGAIRPFF